MSTSANQPIREACDQLSELLANAQRRNDESQVENLLAVLEQLWMWRWDNGEVPACRPDVDDGAGVHVAALPRGAGYVVTPPKPAQCEENEATQ